jgi:hypothetical protein
MRQITHVAARVLQWRRVDPAPTTAPSSHAARRAHGAVLVALVPGALVVVGGCNRDDTADPFTHEDAPAAITARASTSAPSDATMPLSISVPPAPVTTAPAPDATTTLTTALDTLAAGYHFVTTATVDEQVAVMAEGDHVAGTTRMTVTSGGTSTNYLVTPDAAWAQTDGEWRRLDSAQGLSDPVGQLRAPLSVELVGTAEAATITARYKATALGIRGDGERAVEFQLDDGRITSLHYSSTGLVTGADGTTSERRTDVTAVITAIASGTEITLPAAEA